MPIPMLNPETAFAMTGLSGWSLGGLLWVVTRSFPRQGVRWITASMGVVGTGYLLIALSDTFPTEPTLRTAYALVGVASSLASLGLRRFLMRKWDAWDLLLALTPLVFPVLWTVLSWGDFVRWSQLSNAGFVVQIAMLCTVVVHARKEIVGNGWKVMLLGAAIQAMTVLPFAMPSSPPGTMSPIPQSMAGQITAWALCATMFLNLQLSVLSYLMLLQDRRSAAERVAAELDALTRLPNRRSLERQLLRLLPALQREGMTLGVILLDIDHFKRVNDTQGHDIGDLVLQHVASVLRQHLRQEELLARYGGEEFVIVLTRTSLPSASKVAERLLHAVRETPLQVEGLAMQVTVSAGLHVQPLKNTDAASPLNELWPPMLREADQAMYEAKRAGRDRFAVSAASNAVA
ncbi:GGDEF domain-containing protein [Diaphorobacter caeni]|uniref:GGDEF domain-containing protein n=1 Tax=Diaphorobacter caeni TaxID=2784387 RepID=UPI001890ACE9|nr:GGDEF domain-containing protein [Diaphorobacter caeni]MBF5006437.1 GGDEF domain-containing protein [Diaphorobacter caeni]